MNHDDNCCGKKDAGSKKAQNQLREHTFDGIHEYDNSLPRWWVWLFYLCIAFSVFYVAYYQFGPGKSLLQVLNEDLSESSKKMAEQSAGQASALSDKSSDPNLIAAGKEVYNINCMPCHGANGEGVIGPNLTDKFWIHGGTSDAILKSISEGVLDKGMPAWGPVLGVEKVTAVSAFILSIKNTEVAGKAPQGNEEK